MRVNKLSRRTNLAELAQLIQQQCKLIHPSKLPELEQLLAFLQTRNVSSAAGDRDLRDAPGAGGPGGRAGSMLNHLTPPTETAVLGAVDTYLEDLYEEAPGQIRATALLLQLVPACCAPPAVPATYPWLGGGLYPQALNKDNLEELVYNDTLMGALARVLREGAFKNMDLAINITHIFYCFARCATGACAWRWPLTARAGTRPSTRPWRSTRLARRA